MFTAGATADIKAVSEHVYNKTKDYSPLLFAVGFSLGANILTKYLGETEQSTKVSSISV